jgi:hypothetical protein
MNGFRLVAVCHAFDKVAKPVFCIVVSLMFVKLYGMSTVMEANNTKWITIDEAAAIIGCTPDHARYLARNNRLTTQIVGKRMYLVDEQSAVEFANTPQQTGRPKKFLKS